jgi:hypothetical protein
VALAVALALAAALPVNTQLLQLAAGYHFILYSAAPILAVSSLSSAETTDRN